MNKLVLDLSFTCSCKFSWHRSKTMAQSLLKKIKIPIFSSKASCNCNFFFFFKVALFIYWLRRTAALWDLSSPTRELNPCCSSESAES